MFSILHSVVVRESARLPAPACKDAVTKLVADDYKLMTRNQLLASENAAWSVSDFLTTTATCMGTILYGTYT